MQTVEREDRREEAGAAEDLERLIRLIDEGRVAEARSLSSQLTSRWPDVPAIQRLSTVLEPPRVVPGKPQPARPLDRERAWLQQHAHEYPGCWLAVCGDRLLAATPVLREALRVSREAVGGESPVLFFQPEK